MLGTVHLKSRPLRLALLVDLNDPETIREAIKINTSLWGGVFNPLLPLFGARLPQKWAKKPFKSPKPQDILLGYLQTFDPDALINCTTKELPEYLRKPNRTVTHAQAIWSNTGRNRLIPKWGIGLPELLNHIFERHFRFLERYPHKVRFLIPPKRYSLFWTAVFGQLPDQIENAVQTQFAEGLAIEHLKASTATMKELFQDPSVLYPLRITRSELQQTPQGFNLRREVIFYMDARSNLDIVDYWNLRALGRPLIPAPHQFAQDENVKALARQFLKAAQRPLEGNPQIELMGTIVCSRSTTMDQAQKFRISLQEGNDSPKMSVQHWYPQLWDEESLELNGEEPHLIHHKEEEIEIPDGEGHVRLRTAIPQFAELILGDTPRLANELEPRVYGSNDLVASALPPQAGKNVMAAISEGHSMRDDFRLGRNGLVKLVKYDSLIFWRPPQARDVFFAWLKDSGWEPELSPPGLIAQQLHMHLNGWVAWLKNEDTLRFLERMATTHTGSGAHGDYIRNSLKGEFLKGEHLFQRLLQMNIFAVGYENQCPRCFRRSWHPLKDLQDILTCPKCLHLYSAACYIAKGAWTYKLTGPFSIDHHADGAYCVLLSLNFLMQELHHLSTTPVMSFRAKSAATKELEADFGIIWHEANIKGKTNGVILGECKTFCEFAQRDYDRIAALAKTFPGAILAFCTLRKQLTKAEQRAITKIAKAGRKYWKHDRPINPVLILTGHELLNHLGPPYCWHDLGFEEKYRSLVGLFEFCDATQQIHLGLGSWRQEWHDVWERQRQRRAMHLQRRP